jgi:hypothetical protein
MSRTKQWARHAGDAHDFGAQAPIPPIDCPD